MPNLNLTYYPDITQDVREDKVKSAIEVFAKALGIQLTADLRTAVEVTVLPVLEVPEQYSHILRGEAHIALMKPVAYVFAHRKNAQILPACVAHRPIDDKVGVTYFAQLYARRDANIASLEDLASHETRALRIAYGHCFSTSNFLIPACILKKHGIHPFLFFEEIHFTGGHDKAAEAVYLGRAHVGAGHDGVIKILAQKYPDAEERLIRIGREDIHSDPVVVHSGILPVPVTFKSIQDACTAIAKQDDVKVALDLFWGWVKDLSPTEHQNYKSIEDALNLLQFSEEDMLR